MEYDDYMLKQSFDLSTELHINKYEMIFKLNSVPEKMVQYRNISQSYYIPIPEPVTITSSLQFALFFHYYKPDLSLHYYNLSLLKTTMPRE